MGDLSIELIMDFKGIVCVGVDRIYLPHDRVQLWAFVNTAI